jgi:chemotaxis protein MotA
MLLAMGALVASIVLDRGNPATLLQRPALLLVFGGAIATASAGCVRRDLACVPRALLIALRGRPRHDPVAFAEHLLAAASAARVHGIVELQRGLPEARRDSFLRTGIELVMTTSDPERVREVLSAEIEGVRRRHQISWRFLRDMAGYAPTLGILGTVIGLVRVLGNLSTPADLGPAIASAFTATLWGVLSANLVWLPLANKLRRLSDDELSYRELVVEGLLAVQEGASGLRLKDRLDPYLAPALRPDPLLRRARRAA